MLIHNLLLLMLIAVLPWTTALLAEYLREDDGQHLAAAIYGGSLLAMALSFFAMQRYLLVVRPGLVVETLGPGGAYGDHAPQHGRAGALPDRDGGRAALVLPRARDLRRGRPLLRAAGDDHRR